MEGGNGLVLGENGRANPNDVIQIAEIVRGNIIEQRSGSQSSSKNFGPASTNFDITELEQDYSYKNQNSTFTGSASPDKSAETPSSQFLTRRRLSSRSMDPLESDDAEFIEAIIPMTPKQKSSSDDEEVSSSDDEEEEEKQKRCKVNKFLMAIELIAFICVMGLLIASLIVRKLKNHYIWELKLWKWCVFVLVIFCGQLVTKWLMIVLIYLIEKNFKLKLMVLYYLDGLRNSARAFIWLGLILLSWSLLFELGGVERSKETKKFISNITRHLVACLVGTVLWMVKTYTFKFLVASRLSKRFFDQIQEAMFDEYVISTMSGPPLEEMMRLSVITNLNKKEEKEEKVIRASGKCKKMKKISAWTMEKLINHICTTKLSTVSDKMGHEDDEPEIKIESEWEAKAAAQRIFRNVAVPGCE